MSKDKYSTTSSFLYFSILPLSNDFNSDFITGDSHLTGEKLTVEKWKIRLGGKNILEDFHIRVRF